MRSMGEIMRRLIYKIVVLNTDRPLPLIRPSKTGEGAFKTAKDNALIRIPFSHVIHFVSEINTN